MPQTNALISIVDDDPSISRMLRRVLISAGYDVDSFCSAEELLHSGRAEDCACLILDMNLPGIGGPELQRRLQDSGKEIPIIFISADADETAQQTVMDAGAAAFFSKPFPIEALLAAIRSVVCFSLA